MRPLVTSVLNNFSFIMGIRLPDLPYFTGDIPYFRPLLPPPGGGEAAGKNKIMSRILLVRLSRETRDAEPLKLHSGSGSGSGSGFLLVPVPAQRSKRKQIQLAYDCRLDVSHRGCALCTNGCTRVQI